MGQVSGIRAKLSMEGVDLGTKSMTNVMQSKEAWAKGILEADRAPIKNAVILNPGNDGNTRYSAGNSNLYGALSLGLNIQQQGWESQDPTAQKAMNDWTNNLNGHDLFRARNSYTPKMLLQIAADAEAAACQIRKNVNELCNQAEIGPNDIAHWKSVADGLSDYCTKLQNLHEAVCKKQGPEITHVSLDIAAKEH